MSMPQIFGDADFDEIIHLIQIVLVRKNLEVNRENTYNEFIQQVRNNLHVAILMNPREKYFRKNLNAYPAILKYCVQDWFMGWPQEALVLATREEFS